MKKDYQKNNFFKEIYKYTFNFAKPKKQNGLDSEAAKRKIFTDSILMVKRTVEYFTKET